MKTVKEMNEHEKISIIQEVLSWDAHSDACKVYYIQAFLLGWAMVDDIHRITNTDRRETA